MTMQTAPDERFDFDRADRLRKALRTSGVSVQEMADHLEVSRNAVSSWINGHNKPRRRDLSLFALRTGYPIGWLDSGTTPPEKGPEEQTTDYGSAVSPVISLAAFREKVA